MRRSEIHSTMQWITSTEKTIISYDRETKQHFCKIERAWRRNVRLCPYNKISATINGLESCLQLFDAWFVAQSVRNLNVTIGHFCITLASIRVHTSCGICRIIQGAKDKPKYFRHYFTPSTPKSVSASQTNKTQSIRRLNQNRPLEILTGWKPNDKLA